jgi:hypothetical protein
MMTPSPASQKLQQARFYLEQIRLENQKGVSSDLSAVYLGDFLINLLIATGGVALVIGLFPFA